MIKKLALPSVIGKNVFLFLGGFVCFIIAFQIGIPLFAKAAVNISGKKELAGLPLTIMALGAILASIPFGKMADKVGRKLSGILSTLVIGIGFVVIAWGSSVSSFTIYLSGSVLIGAGMGGVHLFVLAVNDMFLPKRKGEASGLAMMAMYTGAVVGPALGGVMAGSYGFTYAFLIGCIFAALGLIVLLFVNPDPLEIGSHLEKYYPEWEEHSSAETKKELRIRNVVQIFRLYPIQVSFWSRILIHAPRFFLIVLVPIILTELGFSMAWVGILITVMGIGSFVVSFPIGRLADRFGRKMILFAGAMISLIAIAGAMYTVNIVLLVIVFLAIGFGFSAVNNVAPTMVADVTHPKERGKAMGFFGIASGAGAVLFPMLSSWVYGTLGPIYVSWIGAGIMLVIVLLLIPLHERAPGIYDNDWQKHDSAKFHLQD